MMSKRFNDFINLLKENDYEKEITDEELNKFIKENYAETDHNLKLFKANLEFTKRIERLNEKIWLIK